MLQRPVNDVIVHVFADIDPCLREPCDTKYGLIYFRSRCFGCVAVKCWFSLLTEDDRPVDGVDTNIDQVFFLLVATRMIRHREGIAVQSLVHRRVDDLICMNCQVAL